MMQMPTDKEMVKWAGLTYDGDELPIQVQRLIWIARTQGMRIAWRDMYQISAAQHDSYSMSSFPGGLAAKNSVSVKA